MSDVVPPTQAQLWEDLECELTSIHRESDDDWRHGSTVEEVFRRDADQTYWWVYYRKQTDGEWNGLREGDYEICQVEPYQKITIGYRTLNGER